MDTLTQVYYRSVKYKIFSYRFFTENKNETKVLTEWRLVNRPR